MLNDLEIKIQNAYLVGDLEYFHGKQFIQDIAALGWGLGDLPSSSIVVMGDDGKFTVTPIWPDIDINFMMKVGLVRKS
jgi:hypothetical protein